MTSVTEKNTTKKGLRKGNAGSGTAILHRMLGDGGPQNEVKGGEGGAIQCPGKSVFAEKQSSAKCTRSLLMCLKTSKRTGERVAG